MYTVYDALSRYAECETLRQAWKIAYRRARVDSNRFGCGTAHIRRNKPTLIYSVTVAVTAHIRKFVR